jgi:hypothetical protein
MENALTGKNILIVQGSLLAGTELRDALVRAGAHAYLTCNLISAFDLVQKHRFDGARPHEPNAPRGTVRRPSSLSDASAFVLAWSVSTSASTSKS